MPVRETCRTAAAHEWAANCRDRDSQAPSSSWERTLARVPWEGVSVILWNFITVNTLIVLAWLVTTQRLDHGLGVLAKTC